MAAHLAHAPPSLSGRADRRLPAAQGCRAKGMIMHSPRWRRAARAAALAASLACGALYAQTVNLKPGKYELVSTSQVTLPPAMVKGLPPGYLERLQKPRSEEHTSELQSRENLVCRLL